MIKRLILIAILLHSIFSFAVEEKIEQPMAVVIDPGHGGNDTGTSIRLSSQLIKESDLTLKLSQKIIHLINEKYAQKIKVIETRNKNHYIPLPKRINVSKEQKADFYLSLHYNSAFSTAISGTEIYFPEDNHKDSKSMSLLDSIKNDLIETGRIKQSLEFSNQLSPFWKASKIKIRRAPFYVLENAETPAILIEIGYLSHPEEQKALLSEKNQDLAAESIVKALVNFKETRDKQIN